jgi:hypothetical protein
MRASTLAAIGFMTISLTAAAQESYKPPSGFVPDAATAIGIAAAVWVPIYGKKQIDSEKPYIATLKGDVWTVVGTFHCPVDRHCVGGVAGPVGRHWFYAKASLSAVALASRKL